MRRAPAPAPPSLRLDRSSHEPLTTQIYRGLRTAILAGELPAGARLPSTRLLATRLRVARNRVVVAYEQLLAEGYVTSAVGSGTRVNSAVPRAPVGPASTGRVRLSPAARRALREPASLSPWSGPWRPFRAGSPAVDGVPLALWGRLLRAAALAARRDALDYRDPLGEPPLRRALAERLYRARGLACDWRQIAIVDSSQQALAIVGMLALAPGDEAWIEDPGYPGARGAWSLTGARLRAVPVDGDGLDVTRGERLAPHARLAYVTPSHQFPTGVTMSLERRLQLLDWARRRGALVVEDDYDSEFRYGGQPLATLHALGGGRVVYVGTFSKTLFPALRLAFAVLPTALVDAWSALRRVRDGFAPALTQLAAARLLDDGHFDRHLRRQLARYRERRDTLVDACGRRLAGAVELHAADTGLHAVAWLRRGSDDRAIARAAARVEVDTLPVSALTHGRRRARPGLLLGFAPFTPAAIARAVELLAALPALRRAAA